MDEQTHPIPAERVHTFRADGTLQMGGRPWTIMHTPGHTSTQTCFHDPQNRLLLAGDMLLATTPTPVVESPPEGTADRVPALPLFLDSLDKLEALDIEMVLPGHGRPFGDHAAVIRRQRKRIHKRKQECLDWIRAGFKTPVELVDKMYAHHPAGLRLTGMWMLVGYLDLLEIEGAVSRREIDGVWHYDAPADRTSDKEST
jgi:glyoxylase-like metal-dependent hydrolase (beta-lactamase superfamily II)